MERRARADALIRAILSVGESTLRAAYVASVVRVECAEGLAHALDVICERAEQAEAPAREALVAIVDALNMAGLGPAVHDLRERAAEESLLALERLTRHPMSAYGGRPASASRRNSGPRVSQGTS